MSDFSVTEVAFSGFRFVRRHPKTAVAWGVIQFAISVAFGLLITTLAGPAMTRLQALQDERAQGVRPDPAVTLQVLHQLAPMYLIMVPFFLIFYPVLYAAMSRAVLRPEESRFAFLRLGADEGRQLLLILLAALVAIGFEIVWLIVMIVVGLLVGLVGGMTGAAPGAMVGLGIFLGVAVGLCAAVFFAVRLSLASPLTFDSHRVRLFQSWPLTRGRFWRMLGVYLLVMVMVLAMFIGLMLVNILLILATGGGFHGLAQVFRPDMSSPAAFFAPVRVVILVLSAALSAVMWPVMLMPQVELYKALKP